MVLNFFRKCGIYPVIFPLILAISCSVGCIEIGMNTPIQEAQDSMAAPNGSSRMELDFSSEVGRDLFKTEGDIVLWSSIPLPYLIMDAKLQNSSQQIDDVRYMMVDIQPLTNRHFEISKNRKISPGTYNCTLEISGPEGPIESETRRCTQAPKGFDEARPQVQYIFITQDETGAAISSDLKSHLIGQAKADKPSGSTSAGSRSDLQGGSEHGRNSSVTAIDGGVVGSTSSSKYHRPDCRYAIKIKPENRVYFANADEAQRQGYQPCKTCNP